MLILLLRSPKFGDERTSATTNESGRNSETVIGFKTTRVRGAKSDGTQDRRVRTSNNDATIMAGDGGDFKAFRLADRCLSLRLAQLQIEAVPIALPGQS